MSFDARCRMRVLWMVVCGCACVFLVPRLAAQNLVDNPSFESGLTNWAVRGSSVLQFGGSAHLGTNTLLAASRTATNDGVQQTLTGKLIPGGGYHCAAWLRTDSASPEPVVLGVEFTDDSGLHATNLALNLASNGGWTFLEGFFDLSATGVVQEARVFVSGPAAGVNLEADDLAVVPLSGMRLAARHFPGVWIGGVGNDSNLKNNAPYARTVTTDYHICGSDNALKFAGTHPQTNTYSWSAADTIVNTGIAHGQQTRGHTLVWHSGLPNWVETNTTWTTGQLQFILFDHIDTVASRYKDKLFCWDVVNEALNSDGTMRGTLWYDQPGIGFAGQGSNYIAEIFRRARAAAPNCKLVYNDYSNEEDNTKSDAMYALVTGFQANGVPIDAVGFQMHITRDGPSLSSMRANFQRFNDLGVDLHITELDVRINIDTNTGMATNIADLAAQANTYFNVFGAALAFPRTRVLQTWGYTDRYSWVPSQFPGKGAALPLDRNYNRKPAWWGIFNVLANQAENLAVETTSSGDSSSFITNTSFSAGRARLFSASAASDFITLKASVPYPGEYSVRAGVRKNNSSGQFQLAAAPASGGAFTNIGAPQDLYSASTAYNELVVGTNTFAEAGEYYFRFTVTGKNGSSSGFALGLDYLRPTPTGSEGNQAPTVDVIPDQAGLKNHDFGPLAFRVQDRETVEPALEVSVVSSNLLLFPTNNVRLTRHGPQCLLYATPAPNGYGTGALTVLVEDADGALTQRTFNLTVTNAYSEPIIEPINDLTIFQDTIAVVPFVIWDTVDDVSALTLNVTTGNTNLVPATNLVITGTGTNRTATITPLPGRVGASVITFVLGDPGGRSATNTFTLQVSPTLLTSTQHLKNPGFEAPFRTVNTVTPTNSITGLLATNWSENSGFSPYWPTLVYEMETNDVPSDSYVQKVTLTTNGNPNFQIIQSFPMETGRIYTASVWMKSLQTTNVTLTIGKSSSPYSTYFTTNATLSNYWRKISISGPAPSNVTARIVLRTAKPGTFWIEEANVTSELINTAPDLVAVSNLAVHAGQTVQITNVTTDAEAPPQTLLYSLLQGPTNAVLNQSNGLFLWRPAASQANTTNQIAIKVEDNGTPVLSDTQQFSVVVHPLVKPTLAGSMTPGSGQFQLHLAGDAGLDYLIQASQDLTNWSTLCTNLQPIVPFDWTDTNAWIFSNQFYRVLLSP